jgi:hypothetical protein
MTDDNAIDLGQDMVPKKRKTTYNRDHPTQNPKPPKRSKAEIQAEAAEKKAATIARKKQQESLHATAEIEKQKTRRTSLKDVAAMEDTIQRKQKQDQLQAERPDLQTMDTYRTILEAEASLAVAIVSATEELETRHVETPPQSNIDPDSDGGLLGTENINFGGEDDDDDSDSIYLFRDNPELEEEEEEVSSDALASVEQGETSKKKGAKKQKVRIPVISRVFIWIYSHVVGYRRRRRASYAQIFKPIARPWHQHIPQ